VKHTPVKKMRGLRLYLGRRGRAYRRVMRKGKETSRITSTLHSIFSGESGEFYEVARIPVKKKDVKTLTNMKVRSQAKGRRGDPEGITQREQPRNAVKGVIGKHMSRSQGESIALPPKIAL